MWRIITRQRYRVEIRPSNTPAAHRLSNRTRWRQRDERGGRDAEDRRLSIQPFEITCGFFVLTGAGWARRRAWVAREASAAVLDDSRAPGQQRAHLIEAKTQGGDKQPLPLTILFNGTELGRWRVGDSTSYLRRRFVIPKEVVNQDTVGHLSFAAPGDHKTSVFGLVALELRDLRPRPGRRGFVDGCSSTRIAGWAVADKVGSTVSDKVNGRPLPHIFTSEVREDLAANGLPEDSGFVLTPKSPIPAGTTIEVEFFDGRPLANSPCRT